MLPIGATAGPVAAGGASEARALRASKNAEVQPEGRRAVVDLRDASRGRRRPLVRHAVETNLREPTAVDGGLAFACDYGGVRIGKVTGIDASGRGSTAACIGTAPAFGSRCRRRSSTAPNTRSLLDPVLGATVALGNISAVDTEPDAAYDELTDQWLVTFVENVSATDVRWAVQFVSNATGLPIPLGFLVGNSGLTSKPASRESPHVSRVRHRCRRPSPTRSPRIFVQLLLMQINSVGAISFQAPHSSCRYRLRTPPRTSVCASTCR